MLCTSSRSASGLALLALAAGFCVVLASTAAASRVSARRAMNRVFAWHLAKGMALEFAGPGVEETLPPKPVRELYFVAGVLRAHPEVSGFLATFEARAESGGLAANATVTWMEGGESRAEAERARRRPR
jgi:hypothetical protein